METDTYMKSARIVKPKESLEVQQLETPSPKGSQVLIKVESSGVCHSDIHLWEGGYEGLEGQFLKTTDRGVKYPLTPGHEIAGIVDSLGKKQKDLTKTKRSLYIRGLVKGYALHVELVKRICVINLDH